MSGLAAAGTATTSVQLSPRLWPAVSLALVSATLLWRAGASLNADTSWLLTVAEHWLDGARLYVDIIETNPPASILLYLPAVLLGRALGASSERALDVLTVLTAMGSVGLSGGILVGGRLLPRVGFGAFLAVGFPLLLLAPGTAFAEREHFAAMFALPLVTAFAVRASGGRLPAALVLAAALGGGFAIAIKPMFALAFAGPAVFCLVRQGRGVVLRLPEAMLACLIPLAYAAAVAIDCPAYLERIVPWTTLAYLPVRASLADMLASEVGVVTLGLVALPLYRTVRGVADPFTAVLSLAAVGFWAAHLIQGKLWPYHAMPAILFAAGALAASLLDMWHAGSEPRFLIAGATAGLALVGAGSFLFCLQFEVDRDAPGLREALARLPPHFGLMAIDNEIALGHPIAREVGARWVGRFGSTWIGGGRASLLASRGTAALDPTLERLGLQEKAIVAADIAARHPDAILVGTTAAAYIASTAALRAAFAAYRPAGTFGVASLWLRDTPADGP